MNKPNFIQAQQGASAACFTREKGSNAVRIPVLSFWALGMTAWTSFLLLWAHFFASFLVLH